MRPNFFNRHKQIWIVVCLAFGCFGGAARAQRTPESIRDRGLPEGVTTKNRTFHSEGVACHGKVFYPVDFAEEGSYPAVVLAGGWAGTAEGLENYAARLAASGIVAMAIDYRSWGKSGGFATLAENVDSDDRMRITEITARIRIKRTRLLPLKQVEDIRNAISFLQGEPGVDRDRIGLWGTSFAGGHVIVTAATDSRVKAGVAEVPSIAGKDEPKRAFALEGDELVDAIMRARTGRGKRMEAGHGSERKIDLETTQMVREYRPFHYLEEVPETVAILFVVAGEDEVIDNAENAEAAAEVLTGPTQLVEIAGATHSGIHEGEAFEQSIAATIEWFSEHL